MNDGMEIQDCKAEQHTAGRVCQFHNILRPGYFPMVILG